MINDYENQHDNEQKKVEEDQIEPYDEEEDHFE